MLEIRRYKSTKRQREYLDSLREQKRIPYDVLLARASEYTGRQIHDLTDLQVDEASALIDDIKDE